MDGRVFAENTTIHFWRETDPRIRIFGNAVVVTYYFEMSFDMGGANREHEWKRHVCPDK